MTSATTNTPQPSQPDNVVPPTPATINISPSQRLEQLPIAALLAFVPRLRTTYRVLNRGRGAIATSRTHYRLRLATGTILSISDNQLDLIRLIDGRRNVQAISDALAVLQGRPVHPAEIVYLLRHRLSPAGLAELSFPPALPEPQPTPPAWSMALEAIHYEEAEMAASVSAPPGALVPAGRRAISQIPANDRDVRWIAPGKRAERLRATRRNPALGQRPRRRSSISLVASLLIVLTAGIAFLFGQASFSHAGFTFPSLSAFFGGITPTVTSGPTVTPTPTPPPQPTHYIVRDGDSLAKIAARFHVTVGALMLVNNLSNQNAISTNQVLIIPAVYHSGENPALVARPTFYVVQQSDNLYTIAQLFGTTQDVLMRYNHIPANQAGLIHPGDTLVIPAPSAVPPQP